MCSDNKVTTQTPDSPRHATRVMSIALVSLLAQNPLRIIVIVCTTK